MKKEKFTRKFTMVFPEKLFIDFEKAVKKDYKTPSMVIRELISTYLLEKEKNERKNRQDLSNN